MNSSQKKYEQNNQMEAKSTMQNSSSLLNRISSESTAYIQTQLLSHLAMCRIDSVVLLAGNIYLPYVSYSLESYFVAQFFLFPPISLYRFLAPAPSSCNIVENCCFSVVFCFRSMQFMQQNSFGVFTYRNPYEFVVFVHVDVET